MFDTRLFDDGTLLITGGTGSFGQAVVSLFLDTGIRQIRIFSRDEKKQDDMRQHFRSDKLKFFIGDVRDTESLLDAFRGVDYVFSAAALKQVPSCEFYPMEALKTNVIGTDNVLNAAISNDVKSVVVLSTDKAVYPINAMGTSKAMMEKIALAKARVASNGQTKVCVTRYGNVMASRGSVIPRFVSQIVRGAPITITDPSMTRFMMLMEDAIDLVGYAFAHGETGDRFVRKAPAATVEQLAKVLCDILRVDGSNIRYIGTRHSEKKHEALLTREEMVRAVDEGDYYRVSSDQRGLDYDSYFDRGQSDVSYESDYTSANTYRLSDEELESMVRKLPVVAEALGEHR